MGLNQRIVPVIVSAIAGLVAAGSTTAAAAASPSGRSTAQAGSGTASTMSSHHCVKVIATIPVGIFHEGSR